MTKSISKLKKHFLDGNEGALYEALAILRKTSKNKKKIEIPLWLFDALTLLTIFYLKFIQSKFKYAKGKDIDKAKNNSDHILRFELVEKHNKENNCSYSQSYKFVSNKLNYSVSTISRSHSIVTDSPKIIESHLPNLSKLKIDECIENKPLSLLFKEYTGKLFVD